MEQEDPIGGRRTAAVALPSSKKEPRPVVRRGGRPEEKRGEPGASLLARTLLVTGAFLLVTRSTSDMRVMRVKNTGLRNLHFPLGLGTSR